MYSGLFGALSNEHRLNIIANNLANVNTTGYKRDRYAFEDTMIHFAHERIMQPVLSLRDKPLFANPVHMAKVRLAEGTVDFEQGALKDTGNPLDLAISGEGFFKVSTDIGELYTRNGHFQIRADGILTTSQGFPVIADGGPLEFPPNAKFRVGSDGQVYADDEAVGQISVVTVSDLKAMEKHGYNMFRIRDGADANEQPAQDFEVAQGYLETPNVNVVEEMVNMIETHRAFEAYQKVITGTKELDDKVIQRVGKVT